MQPKTIVLAAGGTGGHIFPAESLAAELLSQGHRVVLLTDKRYKRRETTPEKMELRVISAASPSGGLVNKMKAAVSIVLGMMQSMSHLHLLKANAVVGFGGYPSVPPLLASRVSDVTVFIHEQNSVLGRANKLVASWAHRIATGFPSIAGVKPVDRNKVVFTGNPVRPAIKALRDMAYPAFKKDSVLNILVTGGSQGAQVLSDVVPAAIAALPDKIRDRVAIDQQCRAEDIEKVREIYTKAGVKANLATFFEDIPARLAACHLFVGRAGASTVAELTIAGRPAILIPYLYAMDDHQTHNARALEEANAACVFLQNQVTSEDIATKIQELMENPKMLSTMAAQMHSLGIADASERLAKVVLEE